MPTGPLELLGDVLTNPYDSTSTLLPFGVIAFVLILLVVNVRSRRTPTRTPDGRPMAARGEFEADRRGFSALRAASSNVYVAPLDAQTDHGEHRSREHGGRGMSFSEAHYPGRPQDPIPALEVAERDLEHLALLGLRARARHRVQRALAPHLTELARTAGWWAALDVQIASTLLDGILAGPRALIVVETRGRDWSLDDLAVAQSKAALLYDSLSTYVQPIYAVVVLTERDDAPRLWTDDDGASAFVMGASWLTHWATAEHRGGIPAHQTRHLNALGTLDQAHALLERDRRHREIRAR